MPTKLNEAIARGDEVMLINTGGQYYLTHRGERASKKHTAEGGLLNEMQEEHSVDWDDMECMATSETVSGEKLSIWHSKKAQGDFEEGA